jgi:hypothetical protein
MESHHRNTVHIANASDYPIWAICDTDRDYVVEHTHTSNQIQDNPSLVGYTKIKCGGYLAFRPNGYATDYISILQEREDESFHQICSVFPVLANRSVIVGKDDQVHNTHYGAIWEDESQFNHEKKTHRESNKHFYLKGNNGKYICCENGMKPMTCANSHMKEWEKFAIEKLYNGKVSLKSMGKYVSSENGRFPMMCDRDIVYEWEMFDMIKHYDGSVSFKGNNGRYVSSENGEQPITCNRVRIDGWEKFYLC